jgi:hypothetical protein
MGDGGSKDGALISAFAALAGSHVCIKLFCIVLAFTVLIVGIEVISKSKSSAGAYLNVSTGLYLLILLVGNTVAGILVLMPFAAEVLRTENAWGYALLGAFFGVFGFQGVLGNTNITIFDRGVLTIADWIGKARDGAVASSVANDVQMKDRQVQEMATRLGALDDSTLNAHVETALGAGTAAQLDAQALAAGANAKLYKALKLATTHPDYVRSIKGTA